MTDPAAHPNLAASTADPIPPKLREPKGTNVTIAMAPVLYEQLLAESQRTGHSMASIVRRALVVAGVVR